jgi:hypothetical protein
LKNELKNTYKLWNELINYVIKKYPEASEEWNFSSFGWSCRIRVIKRVIIYQMPHNGYFKTSFVFGEKAYQQVLSSNIENSMKEIISKAPKYAEGRGFRIDIKSPKLLPSIISLIDIKLSN